MPILLTAGNGAGNPVVNAASIENHGFEINIGWKEQRKDFTYFANLNLSTVKNKVTSLGYGRNEIISGQARTAVGRPIGEFYLIKTDGIFQNEQEVQAHKNSKGTVIQPDAKHECCFVAVLRLSVSECCFAVCLMKFHCSEVLFL